MKRIKRLSVLVGLLLSSSYACFSSNLNWEYQISTYASCPSAGCTLHVGCLDHANDGRDTSDAIYPPTPSPYVSITVYHPEQLPVCANWYYDFRTPADEGTKVWSNIIVHVDGLNDRDKVTLKWNRGADDLTPPPGTYQLVRTDPGHEGEVIDLQCEGTTDLEVTTTTGTIASFAFIVTFGNPLDSIQPEMKRADRGMSNQPCTSPVADADGNIYVGYDNNRIYKINTSGKVSCLYSGIPSGSAVANSPSGSLGFYNGKLYFTNGANSGSEARLNVIQLDGTRILDNFPIPGKPCGSTPAPFANSIYVGTTAGLTLVNYYENSRIWLAPKTQTFNGADSIIYSPAVIPGAALEETKVWVSSADGFLYCLSADLNTILAVKKIGNTSPGSPTIIKIGGSYHVAIVGDNRLALYSASNITQDPIVYTASASIGSTPFITSNGYAFFTTSDGKVQGIDLTKSTLPSLPHFPVTLPATWLSSSPTPNNSCPVVLDGTLYVGAGDAGTGNFCIEIASGDVKYVAGSAASFSTPAISRSTHQAIYANRDGFIYQLDMPAQP